MKRRKKNHNLNISLLPFLSILACLLGALILMITGVTFGRMEETPDPIVDLDQKSTVALKMKEYGIIRSEIVILKQDIASLEKKLSKASQKQKEYENSIKKNSSLKVDYQKLKSNTKNGSKQLVLLSQELDEKKATVGIMAEEKKESEERIKSQIKKIAFRKDPGNHPVTKVNMISSGSIENPYFMECKKDTLTLIENGKETKSFKAPLINDKKFIEFVKKNRTFNKSGIVFLVRENGTEIYDEAKKIATYYYCRTGKIPVRGIGFIDTSMFKKKLPVSPKDFKNNIPDFLKKYRKDLPEGVKEKLSATGKKETGIKATDKDKLPVKTDPLKNTQSVDGKKNELPKATE